MQIHISPRHVKLTAGIHQHVAEKIGHLEHLESNIIGAHVAIDEDKSKKTSKHAFIVKVHVALPGPDIHAEDKGHDLYQAIDLVAARLAEQLRHRKSKITRGKRKVAAKAKQARQSRAAV